MRFRFPGTLSSRLHSDVDRMGRTVALNANALVRSAVKTCLMLIVMLQLSWELTLLTFLEMPLLALVENKYTAISMVRKAGYNISNYWTETGLNLQSKLDLILD